MSEHECREHGNHSWTYVDSATRIVCRYCGCPCNSVQDFTSDESGLSKECERLRAAWGLKEIEAVQERLRANAAESDLATERAARTALSLRLQDIHDLAYRFPVPDDAPLHQAIHEAISAAAAPGNADVLGEAAAAHIAGLNRQVDAERAARERAEAKVAAWERDFPMLDGPPIPYRLAQRVFALYSEIQGTSQSLDRIGQRGGFGWDEVPLYYKDCVKRLGHKGVAELLKEQGDG